MKNFIFKTIKAVLFTLIIISISLLVGFGVNVFFGITLFKIPKTEAIKSSEVLYLLLVFVSVLLSTGIFNSDKLQNNLMKIFSDKSDIVIEIDKNMLLVPEYKFEKVGSVLDYRKASIEHISTIYHFDFLFYNKTFAEATIKEIKMYLGSKNEKVLIAKGIAERCESGYRNGGPFKHFMILKGKSVEKKITFELEGNKTPILLDEYTLNMNKIKFVVEYNSNNKSKLIDKKIEILVDQQDIDEILSYDNYQLSNRIIGPDRVRFKEQYLSGKDSYSCVKGLNHEFKLK